MNGTRLNGKRNGVEARVRMVRLGVRATTLARELRRSSTAVSRAINEDRPVLLARIHRYLDRVDRNRMRERQ